MNSILQQLNIICKLNLFKNYVASVSAIRYKSFKRNEVIKMQKVLNFREISKKYQHYIFDMSGVLTNGEIVFEDAVGCLQALQDSGKDVIVLSNSPRIPDSIRQKLADAGVKVDKVVTSGGFLLSDLKNPKFYPQIRGKCFRVGDNHNAIFEQDDAKFDLVDHIKEADYILINKFFNELSECDEYYDILQQSLELKLPCVCPNPDIIVYHGSKIIYPQGYLANKYEEMGGSVYYYGKPHVDIYEYLNELYSIKKPKSLMIGDNLFTDIKGAASFGIDSLLITSGNHREDDIPSLISQGKLRPTYIAEHVIY